MSQPIPNAVRDIDFHLFQVSMWLDYYRVLTGIKKVTSTGVDKRWIEFHLRISSRELLDNAKEHLRLARIANGKQ